MGIGLEQRAERFPRDARVRSPTHYAREVEQPGYCGLIAVGAQIEVIQQEHVIGLEERAVIAISEVLATDTGEHFGQRWRHEIVINAILTVVAVAMEAREQKGGAHITLLLQPHGEDGF